MGEGLFGKLPPLPFEMNESVARVRTRGVQGALAFLPFVYHKGGCAKWDDGNVYHPATECTCGLSALLGGDPCPCQSCVYQRLKGGS